MKENLRVKVKGCENRERYRSLKERFNNGINYDNMMTEITNKL